MTPPTAELGRVLRTVAHLEPAQVAHRLRLRAQRQLVARQPDRFAQRWRAEVGPDPGLPDGYRAIDATHLADRWDPADIARGSFDLLNHRRELGDAVAWEPPDATQLWSFHLHYWEWAWSLAAAPERESARATFADHWRSWSTATTFGRWDAWAPYPASLRAWILVNVHADLAAGTDLEAALVESIAVHGGFLEHNVELDVGGNHLVKNIKGILGCAVFLDDERLVDVALRHLDRELAVQVLADGGHYELSPSYHCQVLVDLLDMSRLLAAAGRPAVPALDAAIDRMRGWLGAMLMPDGSLPLFNDCEPVEQALIDLIEPHPAPPGALTVLPDSGYVVARSGRFHLVADVGQPGPPSPPGHIHADCLSFALHVDGSPVVVDTGTSEYGSGPRRAHERSTAAHNTVEVDGTDQTEVFGAFRAGRRARATLERVEEGPDGTITITASHDGYRHLPGSPLHRRTWTVDSTGVGLLDRIEGTGRHQVAARLHTPSPGDAGTAPHGPGAGPLRLGPLLVATSVEPAALDRGAELAPCELAAGFGVLRAGKVAVVRSSGELPISVHTHLGVAPQDRPSTADRNP